MTGAAASGATSDRLARVALSRAGEPGDATTASLVRQMGAVEALAVLTHPKLGSGLHARIREVEPERELELAARMGIRFVIPTDDEWPCSLDDLESSGASVQQMEGAPLGLWVRGPLLLSALEESVAIVGSRSSTVYGEVVAGDLAAVVARAGVPVVSGAAHGIDHAAHNGARRAGGCTVAVLACGVDRIYPAAHVGLLRDLAEHFAVVSELPPGSTPTRARFLSRNRVIAALTRATVVVEAALRSGALNTASWADALSRPVMGVPGPVTSATSEGVHQRIRDGGATLVTHGADVLEQIGASGRYLCAAPRAPARPRDALTPTDLRVLDALPASGAEALVAVSNAAGMHVRDVDATLRRLAKGGFVTCDGAAWRRVAQPPPAASDLPSRRAGGADGRGGDG